MVVFLGLGAAAGLLSGLFGIGGGILIVPGLAWIFSLYHFPSGSIMQMAAGTSLAAMAVSTSRAFVAHHRYHVEYWSIYRRWMLPLVIGVLLGVVLAHYLNSRVLGIIFGIFLLMVALKMLISIPQDQARHLPGRVVMSSFGIGAAAVSAMLGIGGGVFALPFLLHYHIPMRRAVFVSIAVSMTVTVVGGLLMLTTGWHRAGLPPHTWGYIYWPAWLGLSIGSLLFVPLGALISQHLTVNVLRRLIAGILIVIGLHLLVHQ